jgi:predicted RND superfamily exporter protein
MRHQHLRQRIEEGFEQFGWQIYHNPWRTLALMLVVIATLLSQLPNLRMDTSTEGFLRDDDPVLRQYNDFREQFGRDEVVIIALSAPDVFDPQFLQKLKALHEELEDSVPHLDDITSLINARDTRGVENELIVQDLLQEWPQSEVEIQAIRARAMNNAVYRNLLLSEDGRLTTIVIRTDAFSSEGIEEDALGGFEDEFAEEPTDSPPAERPYLTDEENSALVRKVQEVITKHKSDEFEVYLAGSPVVGEVLKRAMEQNMGRFMVLAVLAVSLILYFLFRRISGVLLPLVTVILSLLSTLSLMSILGIAFKLPTQIMPSFLLAVGVGASVHLLAIFYRALPFQGIVVGEIEGQHIKGKAIAKAMGHSGLAIAMTSFTTAAGLASFAGSEVAPIGDLGAISALGVLISLVFTLVLLPALLALVPIRLKPPRRNKKTKPPMDRLLAGIAKFSTSRPKLVLTISLAALVFGITGATQVQFSHKPYEWLPKSNPARQATDFLDEKMRGTSTVEVVVQTNKENGLYEPKIMQGLDRLAPMVESIDEGELFVGKTLSVADILKETNRALNENREAFYRIPEERALIAQELFLFENSGSDDLEDFVDSQFSQARFTAKMPWVDAILYGDFIDHLVELFNQELGTDAKIYVTGMIALLGRTMGASMYTMAESYLIAAGVITLMMVLMIGSLKLGLIAMIPNLTPILLTLGLMGWLGLPLDLFTMLIGAIAIGLAVDDTIHFMHNFRRYHHQSGHVPHAVNETLLSTGRAMLITTIVLSTGFFLYMFSTLTNLFAFGLLTGFTILMALLADFFLAPALMAVLHRTPSAKTEDAS